MATTAHRIKTFARTPEPATRAHTKAKRHPPTRTPQQNEMPGHGNLATQSFLGIGRVQPKLRISPLDEPLKRGADQVANGRRKEVSSCGGTCDHLMTHETTQVSQEGTAPASGGDVVQAKDDDQVASVFAKDIDRDTRSATDDQPELATADAHESERLETDHFEHLQIAIQPLQPQTRSPSVGDTTSADEVEPSAAFLPREAASTQEDSTLGSINGNQSGETEEIKGFGRGSDQQINASAPPSTELGMTDKTQSDSSKSMARFASAPNSFLKPYVMVQAELITTDGLASETTVTGLATERRQEVRKHFLDVRSGLVRLIEDNVAKAHDFIATKQVEVLDASTRAIATVHEYVLSTIQEAQAQGSHVAESISRVVESASTSVQSGIGAVVDRVNNIITSIPLPNIPGIAWARRLATNMTQDAAGAVTRALRSVLGTLRRALNVGMNLLHSLLRTLGGLINRAFSFFASAIARIVRMAFRALERMLDLIVSTLRRLLNSIVIPILNQVESRVLHSITNLEQQALEQLRANRDQYLEIMASMVSSTQGRGEYAQESDNRRTSSAEDLLGFLEQIGQQAIANNRAIIASFDERASGFREILVITSGSILDHIIGEIVSRLAQAFLSIVTMALELMRRITGVVQDVITYIQSLSQQLVETIGKLVAYMKSFVQNPVGQLGRFADGVLSRVRTAINSLRHRLISGDWSYRPFPLPEFVPAPKPDPIPVPTEPAPGPAPGPVPAPGPGRAPSSPLMTIIVIAVAIIIIVLILLYLLYKWLTRPRLPKPPKPPKKGKRVLVTIAGASELWWFDGEHPPGYPLEQALTADAGGRSGSFQWSIVTGIRFADFNGSPTAVGPTTTLRSKDASDRLGDVRVKVEFVGSGGEWGETTRDFTVLAPTRLGHLGDTDNTDPVFVYESRISYNIQDQFGSVLPRVVPLNEHFTAAPTADFPGMDWRRGGEGHLNADPNRWDDLIQGETPSHTPTPVVPTDPDAGVKVYHWPGTWQVGSLVIGVGRRVASVIWQKFLGRARHR